MEKPKLKKFRVYHSDGTNAVIECESLTFTKKKTGLLIKPKGLPKIKDAICFFEESSKAEVVEVPKQDDDDVEEI